MLFFQVLREIINTTHSFERLSAKHIRSLGVTSGQFDVVATLGNQPPMTCKELAEKTLIVKGNLTVILESLLKKGIISRQINPNDARSSLIDLTHEGKKLFQEIFPAHMNYLRPLMAKLSKEEMLTLKHSLSIFRQAVEAYAHE
jgi:DNA-binding MarR family transcriptional regulator